MGPALPGQMPALSGHELHVASTASANDCGERGEHGRPRAADPEAELLLPWKPYKELGRCNAFRRSRYAFSGDLSS
jgi:hypothetical protein